MTTGVIGGTGMIGSNIVGQLAGGGEEVRILTRTPPAEMAAGVTHARIVPPASHKHGPHTRGAAAGPDLAIVADGAEEGNV